MRPTTCSTSSGNDSTDAQGADRQTPTRVITALANNSTHVQEFIVEADKAATDTATQQANLRTTLARFPGFLEQLKPAMAKLGSAVDREQAGAAEPQRGLRAAAHAVHQPGVVLQPHTGRCGFANASLPALKSLGQASVTGKQAVQTAAPTVSILNKFAAPTSQGGAGTGELAQNLAIVLHDLDTQSRAVEPDPRSPGGKGFSGLEALLQYVFNQTLAVNTFGPFGPHARGRRVREPDVLAVRDARDDLARTSSSTAPHTGSATRGSGPNQPGVNETDPSDPSACVPDPGGAPPGETGPTTTASKCPAEALSTNGAERQELEEVEARRRQPAPARRATSSLPTVTTPAERPERPERARGRQQGDRRSAPSPLGGVDLVGAERAVPAQPQTSTSTANNGAPSAQQAQQLLNYLLSP